MVHFIQQRYIHYGHTLWCARPCREGDRAFRDWSHYGNRCYSHSGYRRYAVQSSGAYIDSRELYDRCKGLRNDASSGAMSGMAGLIYAELSPRILSTVSGDLHRLNGELWQPLLYVIITAGARMGDKV